jgi:hypothetical protein
VNITYEYRAIFHQSLRVLRVGGSSGNKSIDGAGGGAIGTGLGAIGIGAGMLGDVGMLGGKDGAFAAAPATFSCVLPNAAIPRTAPIAR